MRNHKPDPKLSAHRRAARVLLLVCTLAAYALPFTTLASAQARDAILFRAVTTGQVERVRDFLARGMDPESRDETGLTLLHLAVRAGQDSVVRVLIEAGADLDARTSVHWNGDSALTVVHLAAEHGHTHTVRLLVAQGADLQARSAWTLTPLLQAVAFDNDSTVIALLHNGADVNYATGVLPWGDSALTALQLAAEAATASTIRALLEHGAQVNARSGEEWTALLLAAGEGNAEGVDLMLEYGADVTATNRDGRTALSIAAEGGHGTIVSQLIGSGASVNARSKRTVGGLHGATPLMFAAAAGHGDVVDTLLKHGADLNAKTQGGITALILAAGEGRGNVIEQLADRGASVTAQAADGATALMAAAQSGHSDVVRLLLERGAGINTVSQPTQTFGGGTALMVAAGNGHLQVVKLLIEQGASIRATNQFGSTALMFAASDGHEQVVRFLLEQGADPNARDRDGDTALGYYAAQYGHAGVVEILLKAGAHLDAPNNAGHTPLSFATRGEHNEVVRLLEAAGASVGATPAVNLQALLPTLADLPPGVSLQSEQGTNEGLGGYERDFAATGLLFDLGGSQLMFLNTAAELYESPANARTAVGFVGTLTSEQMNALMHQMLPAFIPQEGITVDSVAAELLDVSQIGQTAVGWRVFIRVEFASFDMVWLMFTRGAMGARVIAVGPAGKVAVKDVAPVAQLIDARAQGMEGDLAEAATANRMKAEAAAKIAEGERLAEEGSIEAALASYDTALAMVPNMGISASSWNTLCWFGALWGHAADVLDACNRAVELSPDAGWIRDSRGVARALTGDSDGAIEDFKAFLAETTSGESHDQRQRWIAVLQDGGQPFTEKVVAELRGPDPNAVGEIERALLDAGFDLRLMVPLADDLSPKATAKEGTFQGSRDSCSRFVRNYEAKGDALFFPLHDSRVLGAMAGVTLCADSGSANAFLEGRIELEPRGLIRWLMDAEPTPEDTVATVGLDRIDPPVVGDRAAAWAVRFTAPFFTLEGYAVVFRRGRLVGSFIALGSPGGVRSDDIAAAAGLLERKMKHATEEPIDGEEGLPPVSGTQQPFRTVPFAAREGGDVRLQIRPIRGYHLLRVS